MLKKYNRGRKARSVHAIMHRRDVPIMKLHSYEGDGLWDDQ